MLIHLSLPFQFNYKGKNNTNVHDSVCREYIKIRASEKAAE